MANTSPSGATCVYWIPFATTALSSVDPQAAFFVGQTPRLMCQASFSVATFDLLICVRDE
jgi:hypothetical protein